MALLANNLGDVASRLRKWARLTGGVPQPIQPNVQPVVVMQDLSIVPYSSEPITFATNAGIAAGAAGNTSMVMVQAAPGTVVVVDQIDLAGLAAVQIVGLSLGREVTFPSPTYSITAGVQSVTLNQPGSSIGGNAPGIPQAKVQGANSIGTAALNAVFFNNITSVAGAGQTNQFRFLTPIVLFGSIAGNQPGAPVNVAPNTGDILVINPSTAATAFQCFIWAREYRLIQGAKGQ